MFEVGTRVIVGDLPEHTLREQEILVGLDGVVTEVGETYIEVTMPEDAPLAVKNQHLFLPEELIEILEG